MLEEDDDAEQLESEREPETVIGVWAENVESVTLFLDTPWVRAGMMGARVGLDYKDARDELRDRGVLDHQPFIADLRVMEAAALEVFGEQAERRMREQERKIRAARRR